jgi:hypothetical protein
VASTLVGSDVDVQGQHTRDIAFTSLAQKTLGKGWTLTGRSLRTVATSRSR